MTTLVSAEEPVTRVLIAKSLAERLQKRIANSEFASVSAYATSVLDQIIEQLDTASKEK